MTRHGGTCLGLILVGALLSACSTTPRYPGPRPAATIIVDNTRAAASTLTVDLVSSQGQRTRLGEVALNERKEFIFRHALLTGYYRLIGRYGSSPVLTSLSFSLTGGDEVLWDLDRNIVWFQGRVIR